MHRSLSLRNSCTSDAPSSRLVFVEMMREIRWEYVSREHTTNNRKSAERETTTCHKEWLRRAGDDLSAGRRTELRMHVIKSRTDPVEWIEQSRKSYAFPLAIVTVCKYRPVFLKRVVFATNNYLVRYERSRVPH